MLINTGHVVCYAASDLVSCASEGDSCPTPSSRFLAYDPSQQKNEQGSPAGVSAIACAGKGTSSSSNPNRNVKSTMILTGGVDGIVKQYEVMRQNTPGETMWRLDHWPRLATQRMKGQAHIFKGHYNVPVTALASQEGSKILSAGGDGTLRVWDSTNGEELYRMDGFDDSISSLCLDKEILVTDGMGAFVCVHDFDIDEDEFDFGYDLDF